MAAHSERIVDQETSRRRFSVSRAVYDARKNGVPELVVESEGKRFLVGIDERIFGPRLIEVEGTTPYYKDFIAESRGVVRAWYSNISPSNITSPSPIEISPNILRRGSLLFRLAHGGKNKGKIVHAYTAMSDGRPLMMSSYMWSANDLEALALANKIEIVSDNGISENSRRARESYELMQRAPGEFRVKARIENITGIAPSSQDRFETIYSLLLETGGKSE